MITFHLTSLVTRNEGWFIFTHLPLNFNNNSFIKLLQQRLHRIVITFPYVQSHNRNYAYNPLFENFSWDIVRELHDVTYGNLFHVLYLFVFVLVNRPARAMICFIKQKSWFETKKKQLLSEKIRLFWKMISCLVIYSKEHHCGNFLFTNAYQARVLKLELRWPYIS